jgi:hypothetical protein
MQQAFERAQSAPTPGAPAIAQLSIGPEIENKLKELDRGRAARGAGRTI